MPEHRFILWEPPVCGTEVASIPGPLSQGQAPELLDQSVLDQIPYLNAHIDRRTRARPCSSSHGLSVTVQGLVQEVILTAVEQSALAMCFMREDLRLDKVSASRAPRFVTQTLQSHDAPYR